MTDQPPASAPSEKGRAAAEDASVDEPIVVDQTDRRTILPFVAAAVFAVIVLAGVVIGGILSPAEKNVTQADRIAGAAQNYVSARAASDERPPAGVACEGFDEAKTPLAAQFGAADDAVVPSVTGQTVNGDRAKASVTVRADGRETTETWNFTRSGDKWLVCG